MRSAPVRVTFREVEQGAMVRLPRQFWVVSAFRRTFPRALPMRRLYCFMVLGPLSMSRLGDFDAEHAAAVSAEARRRRQAARDAEWETDL